MNTPDPLQRITHLYHFTDRRNLPLIYQHGGLYSMVELGRRGIKVPAPGGNQWSQNADGMSGVDRYVHLCFRANHPMEFLARQAGHIQDTIFLQINPSVIQDAGVRFTSEVANKSGATLHTMEEAKTLIDFEVLYTRTDWTNPIIQERLLNAEKCEILVPDFIPLTMIRNFPNG
jgi:ssDNA thymidine ADP-ribosyltransferase DarT-like protein